MADRPEPISWMSLRKGTTVLGSDGAEIGKVADVVADEEKDIFSGIAVDTGLFSETRFVPAVMIADMTEDSVAITLTEQEMEELETYEG